MKTNFFAGFIALMMFGAPINAQTWQIGYPNAADVIATFSGSTLTISGTGAMQDFQAATSNMAPWQKSGIGGIRIVVIEQGVTSIGMCAFYGQNNLTSITIPNSIISIGSLAFQSCFNIQSLIIPNSVVSIGSSAFASCNNLTSLTIPNSVTSMGSSAFASCTYLTSVTVLNSVIGDDAFYKCHNLTSVSISNSVTTIGNGAFSDCINLTPITIPSSVTFIGDNAFYGCSSLKSITIPNSVISIGSSAFYSCSSLTSVSIPSSVTSIGYNAFYNCSSLTSITCLNPTPSEITLGSDKIYGSNVFGGVDKTACVLYVPAGSVSAYQAAPQWQDFIHIVGNATGIENVEIQNFKLFPNPAKDELCITAESQISKVEIYSQDGKMVMQEKNFAGVMNVSTLAKGIYVARVYTQQGVETVKIIKN